MLFLLVDLWGDSKNKQTNKQTGGLVFLYLTIFPSLYYIWTLQTVVFIHPHNQFKVASLSERLLLILFQLFRWRSNSLLTGFLLPIFLATPTPTLLMTNLYQLWGFPGGTVVKNLPANAGDARDLGSVSGLGRSPGVGSGNPLQYSCLKNSMDRGAWRATVHGVAKSQTRLNDYCFLRGWIIIQFLQTRRWRLGVGDLAKVAQLVCARTAPLSESRNKFLSTYAVALFELKPSTFQTGFLWLCPGLLFYLSPFTPSTQTQAILIKVPWAQWALLWF